MRWKWGTGLKTNEKDQRKREETTNCSDGDVISSMGTS